MGESKNHDVKPIKWVRSTWCRNIKQIRSRNEHDAAIVE